jgi:hypothetical protein
MSGECAEERDDPERQKPGVAKVHAADPVPHTE